MNINGRNLDSITINEKDKIVTAVTVKSVLKPETITSNLGNEILVGVKAVKEKTVTMAKTAKGDEFDPRIGVALVLAYQSFGSKTQFEKYVDTLLNKEVK